MALWFRELTANLEIPSLSPLLAGLTGVNWELSIDIFKFKFF